MAKSIHLVIVEDDPFARNWMVLLGARDWRTRVVGEAGSPNELPILFNELINEHLYVDFLVLDTDGPAGENWISEVLNMATALPKLPKILCTGIRANAKVLRQLTNPCFSGYILKNEIRFSFAWAIALAVEQKWVITEDILSMASSIGFNLPNQCLVLDGRKATSFLSKRHAEIARLAFLFSMERRELADELGVSDWGYGLVSEIYKEIGLKDIFADESAVRDYFGEHELIISYVEKIRGEMQEGKKSPDMEALAFHLITMPDIQEVM